MTSIRDSRAALAGLGLVLVVFLGACGGFYRISERPLLETAEGQTADGRPYLTTTVDLRNKDVLSTNTYRDDRKTAIQYLYVYAEFAHARDGRAVIPLFILNLEDGSLKETRGAELISMFPTSPDRRGQLFFELKTRALEKSHADFAMDVWNASEKMVEQALQATGPGAKYALQALRTTVDLLEKFSSEEFLYEARVAIPRVFDQAHSTTAYLLLPTDASGELLAGAREELARVEGKLQLHRSSTGAHAYEGGRAYTRYPYFMIDHTLSSYLEDSGLLPVTISAGCAEISEGAVESAREHVRARAQLSGEQAALEYALLDRAGALVALRGAVTASTVVAAADAYDALVQMPVPPNEPLFTTRFAPRFSVLTSCAEVELSRLSSADLIRQLAHRTKMPFDSSTAPATIESELGGLAMYMDLAENQSLAAVAQTRPYQRATVRVGLLEKSLFDQVFRSSVVALRGATNQSARLDRESDALVLQIGATRCKLCRSEATAAVAAYKAAVLSATAAAAEAERISLLARMAALKVEVEDRQRALQTVHSAIDVMANAAAAAQRIDVLQQRLAEPGPKSADVRNSLIRDVAAEHGAAREILAIPIQSGLTRP